MKYVEVKNTSGARLVISAIRGLVFFPGEVKKVSPATVKHPAVSSYIGRGLTLVTSSEGEEPKAPVPVTTVVPVPAVAAPEPVEVPETAEPMPVEELPETASQQETAGNLLEAYLTAPGVTEDNAQAILNAFPTFANLAEAPLTDVQSASGLSKSAAKRLQSWATSQLE